MMIKDVNVHLSSICRLQKKKCFANLFTVNSFDFRSLSPLPTVVFALDDAIPHSAHEPEKPQSRPGKRRTNLGYNRAEILMFQCQGPDLYLGEKSSVFIRGQASDM